MKFSRLREYNDRLRIITGIHEREKIIRELMKECRDTGERIIAAMLLVGRLSEHTEGLTTGIKEAFLAKDLGLDGRQSMEAIAEVVMSRAEIGKTIYELGDVWAIFRSYLEDAGRKHADKSRIVNVAMFEMGEDKRDVPFLLQILCEKVNNGIGEIMIVNALYAANEGSAYRETVARAYSLNPDLAKWVWASDNPEDPDATVLTSGEAIPGVPLEPQLCARVNDLAKVLVEHNGMTIVQPKLDGQRVHVHIKRSTGHKPIIRIFSRALKDCTEDYPEIVRAASQLPIKQQAILDGELVALGEDDEVAPFSLLQQRLGRKNDKEAISVGVVLYDILLLDDALMATMPYQERLLRIAPLVRGNARFRQIDSGLCAGIEPLREMLLKAYELGEEGLVCKDPASMPMPGARTTQWIKLKPDYMEETAFGDSMDLVVIGYTKGRGRRHGKIGALWVGIRVPSVGPPRFYPICKVGTGFSDEDLDWWTATLQGTERRPDAIEKDVLDMPDGMEAWVQPEHVIEVRAAQITPIDQWAGISLRHPRLIRRRDDKTPKQATSTAEVEIP